MMDSPIHYIPLPKVTAPGAVIIPDNRPVAFTIKDKGFGEFDVYKSPAAFWMDSTRVSAIFTAYKAGATVEMACSQAGISLRQYYYFLEIHPHACDIISICKAIHLTRFMNTLNQDSSNPNTARFVIARRHPDYKKESTKVEQVTNNVVQQTQNAPKTPETKDVNIAKLEALFEARAHAFEA